MAYTNKGNIQKYLMTDINSSFDSQISDWISAAEIFINNYTGKSDGFENSSSSVKYFDGNGKREIVIDEFQSVSSVDILELDGNDVEFSLTEGQEEGYITYPYNEIPKWKLMLTLNSIVGAFYKGSKRIKVDAIWGNSSSVPKSIELATTILVSEIVKIGLSGGEISSETLGDYTVSFDKTINEDTIKSVKNILNQYRVLEL